MTKANKEALIQKIMEIETINGINKLYDNDFDEYLKN